jgi:hypothetical protein
MSQRFGTLGYPRCVQAMERAMVYQATASASVIQLLTAHGFFDRLLVEPFRPAVAE